MPMEPATRPFARQLMRAVLGFVESPDRELLARFVRSRDEEAFAELVRRHGRMVFAVARRVTGHPQDAEDAFQAAFLVLARRASQVKQPNHLANWLYGVAYRTALEARAARRRVLEQTVAAPEPLAPDNPPDGADLRRVIDEELARLPDKYRVAVVLCDLEGLPRAQAAERMQIPEGTLSSRLAFARKVLAGRLARRGITSSAGAIALALAAEARSAVPRELLASTVRAASAFAAGGALSRELVSPTVSFLTDGVIKAMFAHRIGLMLGLVVVSGMFGLGAYGLAQAPANRFQPPAQDPFVVGQGTLLYSANGTAYEPLQPKGEKVASKGIEDDDVPLPAMPTQAVVRVEDGKLIVRQRGYGYQPVVPDGAGGRVTQYQLRSSVLARTYDAADVQVFDAKGNRVLPKAWKEKLKTDVHALVSYDGKLPNPRELALFKEDTLVIVLPGGGSTSVYGVTELAPTPVVPAVPPIPGRPATGAPPAPGAVPSRGLPTTPRSTTPPPQQDGGR
jgi:RNA polymerase sigma factor (sigma-70 family)